MENVVCWRRDDALEIINPDVDAQPDAYFRAVHTDVPIRKQDKDRKATSIVSTEVLLEQFLEAPRYTLVPIIGFSGSGKSHLIRWMNLRIKRDETREVLFVQKAKTNLRDIVKALINRLPEEAQEQYLNMVQGAGATTLTVSTQRTLILNNIQAELENDISYQALENPNEKDEEEYLISGLSGLFIDPYIREQHFLRDDSFAAELAGHVFEKPEGYNPAEKRREFTIDDIPSDVDDWMRPAAPTREFLQFLHGQDQDVSEKAVAIINRHTDAAITRCLNLSGDHLVQIMTEIRQNLKKTGKELILLIEDFARLQGLDRALLQSVLEQGNDELCTLRTAFACTTGFYGSLESTAKTRLTFVIDMDNPLGKGRDAFNLQGLVARYMNAVRLGEIKLLKAWELEKNQDANFEIESACDECEYKVECHGAFGQVEGFGLYPFTHKAIDVMAHRVDEDVDQKFNARNFQTGVLQPVTKLTAELSGRRFPPKSLLNEMGGLRNFPLDEQDTVKKQAPEDADRHLALITLWAGENRAVNLDKGIQQAFGLQSLSTDTAIPEPQLIQSEPDEPPTPDPRPREIDELSRWANSDTKMTQQLANDLRPLVFDALLSFINWDEIACPRTFWAGPNGVFKQNGVIFENQSTMPRSGSQITLIVPLNWDDDADRTNTFLALSGLIESRRKRNWNFQDAQKKFVCLQECLGIWAADITRQILELKQGPNGWVPAAAALEVSALGVLLSTPQENVPNKIDLLELGLQPISNDTSYLSQKLEKLVAAIGEKQPDLLRTIGEGVAATKGGQIGQFLNSNILIEAMKAFRTREYRLMALPDSDDVRLQWHKDVYALAKSVTGQLDSALHEEVELRLKWLADVDKAFGDETDENKVSDLIRTTVSDISKLGIPGSNELQNKANQFAQVRFSNAVRVVRALKKEENVRPWHIATGIRAARETSVELIKQADQVLARAKRDIEAKLEDVGYKPDAIDELRTNIRDDLGVISAALQGSENAESN
jgi:hypothetical protein